MKIKKIKNKEERLILSHMVMSRSVLAKIATKWGRHGNLFRASWSNMIGQWCVDHYRKYEVAPKHHIQERFDKWAGRSADTETVELVKGFLVSLSSEYRKANKQNVDYVIDTAANHFNKVRMERVKEDLEELLEAGRTEKATSLLEAYSKIEMGAGSTINLLTAKDAVIKAFAEGTEPIIKYPGKLGQFINSYLTRDSFIVFQAPEKGGKSFWLLDIAVMALKQRCKVAIFVLGDMSEGQVIKRYGVRLAGIPMDRKDLKVKYPVKLRRGPQEDKVSHKTKRFESVLTWRSAYRAFRDFQKGVIKSKENYCKLQVYGADELSVAGIDDQLRTWESEGFVADVVIIDYADNLDMNVYGTDIPRDQNNKAWKAMRRLAQKWHNLVVSATQSNAAAYQANEESKVMTRKNFSEDKRKLAHVNGMLGLNQFPGDADIGVCRLNWIVVREGHFSPNRTCHVAGCLPLGKPHILSE